MQEWVLFQSYGTHRTRSPLPKDSAAATSSLLGALGIRRHYAKAGRQSFANSRPRQQQGRGVGHLIERAELKDSQDGIDLQDAELEGRS
jgi:hypothetical protein